MDPNATHTTPHVPHGSTPNPDLVDFSANTNPHTPAGTTAVYTTALEAARRYPPEPPTAYTEAAAAFLDTDPAAIIPTPGGLAAIRLAIETTVTPGDHVLIPTPSFGEYARETTLQGATPTFVPHTDILATPPDDYALVILCNPNNPTGTLYDHAALTAYARRCNDAGTPLLVDEAFLGFTTAPSLAGHPGVTVARSLTKLFGLPGLRAGYAVATDTTAEALHTARPPWNVSTPALRVGEHCLQQHDFVHDTRRRIATERARLTDTLSTRFDITPSEAPFLLLRVPGDVDALIAQTREHGVVVRDARTFRGLDSHIRVAIKTPDHNDLLLDALDVDS